MPEYQFHDLQPEELSLKRAVLKGLAKNPKEIPPKFFYDETGSRLFDQICELPEYYITRTERQLLIEHAKDLAQAIGEDAILIEPGAGNAEKVRLLLEETQPKAYVAMDISGDYLESVVADLALEYPWLQVHGVCMDFSHELRLPEGIGNGRKVVFFPGSSLGNFDPRQAEAFLQKTCQFIGPDGALLIGVDTKKDARVLHDAYNDDAGITADFNLNLLERISRELDTDIDPSSFKHDALYNSDEGRIEMHLVSNKPQVVRVNGDRFEFRAGESIHTESSYKYSPEEFTRLAARAGLRIERHWTDSDSYFSLYLAVPD